MAAQLGVDDAVRMAFVMLDTDADGYLSRAEFKAGLQPELTRRFPGISDTTITDLTDFAFAATDADGDGRVGPDDFTGSFSGTVGPLSWEVVLGLVAAVVKPLSWKEVSDLRECFAASDLNNDGYLDMAGLRSTLVPYFRRRSPTMSEADEKALLGFILTTADVNGDGLISQHEFILSYATAQDVFPPEVLGSLQVRLSTADLEQLRSTLLSLPLGSSVEAVANAAVPLLESASDRPAAEELVGRAALGAEREGALDIEELLARLESEVGRSPRHRTPDDSPASPKLVGRSIVIITSGMTGSVTAVQGSQCKVRLSAGPETGWIPLAAVSVEGQGPTAPANEEGPVCPPTSPKTPEGLEQVAREEGPVCPPTSPQPEDTAAAAQEVAGEEGPVCPPTSPQPEEPARETPSDEGPVCPPSSPDQIAATPPPKGGADVPVPAAAVPLLAAGRLEAAERSEPTPTEVPAEPAAEPATEPAAAPTEPTPKPEPVPGIAPVVTAAQPPSEQKPRNDAPAAGSDDPEPEAGSPAQHTPQAGPVQHVPSPPPAHRQSAAPPSCRVAGESVECTSPCVPRTPPCSPATQGACGLWADGSGRYDPCVRPATAPPISAVRARMSATNSFAADVSGCAVTEDQLAAEWMKYDPQGTGFASREHFRHAYLSLEWCGLQPSSKEIDRIFHGADDRLSYDEFCVLMLRRARI
eukprot:TRINITY_DN3182_c0_g1_i1.p1 TRINITY_DN3182_c0_g1~~TRINITY_DN3182_c0_g1_i1.p1  ORF type:complete len:716 (+),score=175.52 TRINITY_DN3182_c0_g1_i1:56-2149(+)